MKRLAYLLPFVLAFWASSANAFFFFFIPGSVTSKIGDALSGAEGDSCVSSNLKVGDSIPSPVGNGATIKVPLGYVLSVSRPAPSDSCSGGLQQHIRVQGWDGNT